MIYICTDAWKIKESAGAICTAGSFKTLADTIVETSYSNHAHSPATACDRYEIDKHVCMRTSVAVHLVTSQGQFEGRLSNYATRLAIIRENNINSLMVPDH